jgi:hypothetical protein
VLASSAVALGFGGVGAVTLIPATVASSARILTLTPVISLNAAGVASSARVLTLTPVISLNAAGVAATAQVFTLIPRVQLGPAGASVSTVVLSFSGDRGPGRNFMVINGAEAPLVVKAAKAGALVDVAWLSAHS